MLCCLLRRQVVLNFHVGLVETKNILSVLRNLWVITFPPSPNHGDPVLSECSAVGIRAQPRKVYSPVIPRNKMHNFYMTKCIHMTTTKCICLTTAKCVCMTTTKCIINVASSRGTT